MRLDGAGKQVGKPTGWQLLRHLTVTGYSVPGMVPEHSRRYPAQRCRDATFPRSSQGFTSQHASRELAPVIDSIIQWREVPIVYLFRFRLRLPCGERSRE